ncbi:receptor-like protein kinase-like, partial [Trifolium medium]|nr:receptor-like protein kinase-like [Trifolium medium]
MTMNLDYEYGPSTLTGGGGVGFIYDYEYGPSTLTGEEMSHIIERVMETTENLNDRYIIGRGAHGVVYKAVIGQLVCAVKKVEFEWNKKKRINIMRNEIEVLEKFKHRNLIKCYGCWIGNDYALILSWNVRDNN